MVKSLRCLVSGRVQGVGFRYFVLIEASSLGLAGWARNLPDGRVEALLQGPEVAVDEMLARLRRGPVFAKVDGLDVEAAPDENMHKDFQIRR